jgi:hypothetical protein
MIELIAKRVVQGESRPRESEGLGVIQQKVI